jgi:hypothetical protein
MNNKITRLKRILPHLGKFTLKQQAIIIFKILTDKSKLI